MRGWKYLVWGLLMCGVVLGCTREPDRPTTKAKVETDADEHTHERDKMLLADAGQYHAALTAHLSPKGNELDLFFETTDSPPKPVALPLTKLTATVRKIGEGEPREIIFEPAPAQERPKDEKPGTCSHFVAKVDWLKPDDNLTIIMNVEIEGNRRRVQWSNFIPNKYAHHHD